MKYSFLLIPVLALAACGRAPRNAEMAPESTAAQENSSVKTTVSANTPTDSAKIIRTADFSIEVSDVLGTTTQIERQVRLAGGKVTESKVMQRPSAYESYPVSADSIKQVSRYTATASLQVQVPSWQTDSFLNYIGSLPGITHVRNTTETDVTIDYLENQLRAQSRQKLADKNPAPKTTSIGDLADLNDAAITNQVSNMHLKAQTAYTSISFELEGKEHIETQIVPNWETLSRPSFGTRVKMAGIQSIYAFGQVMLGVIYLLPYVLAVLLAVLIFRKRHILGWPKSWK